MTPRIFFVRFAWLQELENYNGGCFGDGDYGNGRVLMSLLDDVLRIEKRNSLPLQR